MQSCSACYNIHDIVRIRITGDKRQIAFFDKIYGYFKTADLKEVDMLVEIGRFKLPETELHCFSKNFFVKDKFYAARGTYKTVRWHVAIDNLAEWNPLAISFHGSCFSRNLLNDFFLAPLLNTKLAERGYAAVHSSCIADKNNAVLFTSFEDVGKSTTMLKLVEKGIGYVSDEYTLLRANGEVLNFPTPVSVHRHNLLLVPAIQKNITISDRVNLIWRNALYNLTGKYIDLTYRVSMERIFPEARFIKSSRLSKILLLTKYNGPEIFSRPISKDSILKKIDIITKTEHQRFDALFKPYLCIKNGKSRNILASYYSDHNSILASAISDDVECKEVMIPPKYGEETFRYILSEVKKAQQ